MLALSPATKDGCCDGISSEFLDTEEDFHGGDLLDIIDFDDLFGDHTLLPDLELDSPPPHHHHIFAGDQFSDDHVNASSSSTTTDGQEETNNNDNKGISGKGEEFVSKREDDVAETVSYDGKCDRKRKYSSLSCSSKNNNRINNNKNEGKRKVKVDWTAELHRRFVEAVEKLGLEKAVPSRILDLMGVHCLTRHNVASHLQKYRSHRKHLLAREAEAAAWTRKRHSLYGLDHNLPRSKTNSSSSWFSSSSSPTTTIGFPPPPRVPHVHHQLISTRPLYVWGHPTVIDQSQHNNMMMMMMMMMWPKHLSNNIAMAPTTPPLCLSHSPFWPRRYKAPPAAGILHAPPPLHTGYKPDNRFASAPPLVDLHPSKESVDAAIGDVLTRPWLPLPLGLKPPAVEGVMKELHRHGVSDVPPPTTASCA
ncbi:unnamed protein product [Cochlearia groenlandica]